MQVHTTVLEHVPSTNSPLFSAGGVYREALDNMVTELESPSVPVLVKCPNGVDSAGENRDTWLVSPSLHTDMHYKMLRFLGQLMGIAIRTRLPIKLSLSPVHFPAPIMNAHPSTHVKQRNWNYPSTRLVLMCLEFRPGFVLFGARCIKLFVSQTYLLKSVFCLCVASC